MKRVSFYTFLALFFILISNAYCQSTKLLFHKKSIISSNKYINIFFSNSSGYETVSPEEINQSEYIYFCYNPSRHWFFKEKELNKDLNNIVVSQNGNIIKNTKLIPIIKNENIIKVVAYFRKDDLVITKPFNFSNDLEATPVIHIQEIYWPNYNTYSQYYTDGAKFYDDKNYLKSFDVLKPFLIENEEIMGFSFYKLSMQILSDNIKYYIGGKEASYKILTLDLAKSINENSIQKLDTLYKSLVKAEKIFNPYFESQEKDNGEYKQKLDKLISDANQTLTKCVETFESTTLSIFEISNYNNYKFSLYIDLLANILCYTDSLKKSNTLDTLNITILNKFKKQKEELIDLEWLNEFESIMNLINNHIVNDGYILNDAAINNLENNKSNEKQPYYDIFVAYNSLCKNDINLYSQYINQALTKCSDKVLLSYIEQKNLSLLISNKNIDNNVFHCINTGLDFESNNEIDKAEEEYKKATKLSSGFAPVYFYLGRIYHKKNENFIAQTYFEKSLDIYPQYIASRSYLAELLINANEDSLALEKVNSALNYAPIWYFYYLKSKILFNLNRYEESKELLINQCLSLNSQNFNQYVLLGDVYLELGNKLMAKKYYLFAGKLEPENIIYSDRLKALNSKK